MRTVTHHPVRTWVKATWGMALTTAGFLLHREVQAETLRVASIVLFAAGLLLTRHYGIQAGQLRALRRERLPYRLDHRTPGILLRLTLALAAAGSCAWIHFETALSSWLRYVPIVGLALSLLLVLQYFRRLVLGAVADVKAEEG